MRSAAHSAARLCRSTRSGTFPVSDAARSNSARASSNRPSFLRRSPRTAGSRWYALSDGSGTSASTRSRPAAGPNAIPTATAGEDWVRPALCEEAIRLGRILAELVPLEPEVHGVVALMEIQASRLGARVGPAGEPVLLLDQDRSRWDRLLIRRGLAALERAERLGGAMGPYALQAAIAACHARATTAAETDWPRIVALYDAVAQLAPSPVVELNRAVAVGMAFGPAAGLDLVDALVPEPSLKAYHLLPAVRGDLLRKLGRPEEARAEFERAASLTENVRERELLQRRAAECAAERMAG